MGIKDIKKLFTEKTSLLFKVSITVSILALIGTIIVLIHGDKEMKLNYSYNAERNLKIAYFLFVVQIVTLYIRNYSTYRFVKGSFVILGKLLVIAFFAFLLIVMNFTRLVMPDLINSDYILLMGSLVNLSVIKILLG